MKHNFVKESSFDNIDVNEVYFTIENPKLKIIVLNVSTIALLLTG